MVCAVLWEGVDATPAELEAHLAESFPDWWLPDEYEFLDQMPKLARGSPTGKYCENDSTVSYWKPRTTSRDDGGRARVTLERRRRSRRIGAEIEAENDFRHWGISSQASHLQLSLV